MPVQTDGTTEQAWIKAQLTPLCGGRVWETIVPDAELLEIQQDAKIQPYIVMNFAEPFSSQRERGIAQEEDQQPHIMSSSVAVYGSNMNDVQAVMKEVRKRLVGKAPSSGSTTLRATGGFSYPGRDTGSTPTRVSKTLYLRNTIGVAS